MISPIKRFWKLLRLYKKEIKQIYIFALFTGLVNLTLPLGIQAIINFLQTGEMTTTWAILVGVVLLGIALTGVFQVYQLRIVENIQQNLFARSGFEFAHRLPRIKHLELDHVHTPELVNRFFDTLTIQKGLPKILIDFSLAVFQITFGLILLTIYSPFFIMLGMVLTFILWFIFKITGPKGLDTSIKESKHKYLLAHWLEELARVNRSIKMIPQQRFHLEKTDDVIGDYLGSRERHFQVLISQFRLFVGFKVILAAGLLLLGGFLVFREQMNIGQFVAAEIIIILIINSVEKALRTIETIYDVLTALDKIGTITDLPLDESGGNRNLIPREGLQVQVKNLSFEFPGDRKKVLENLNFSLEANDKVVLKGKSGSGKSVLLQLLAGIHRVEDGEIYINGIPSSNYKKSELFKSIGISFSANQIFEGSYRENIVFGRNVKEELLDEVLEILGLNEHLIYQSNGIDCPVDSGGRRLPRSIIQKILVARLLVGQPKLMLMEDPLVFMDDDEKKKIIDYLMDPSRQTTVMVVSDFPYWREKCQRIIDLDQR